MPTVREVPTAALVFCSSLAPMHLEISTLAPVASPVKIETSRVIRLPHAPTAATAGPSTNNASTATSAAWKRMLIVLVMIIGKEKEKSDLKTDPSVKEFFFIVSPPARHIIAPGSKAVNSIAIFYERATYFFFRERKSKQKESIVKANKKVGHIIFGGCLSDVSYFLLLDIK